MRTKVKIALAGAGLFGFTVLALGFTGPTLPQLQSAPAAPSVPPVPQAPQAPAAPQAPSAPSTSSVESQAVEAEIAARAAEQMARLAAARAQAEAQAGIAAEAQTEAQAEIQERAAEQAEQMAELSAKLADLKGNLSQDQELQLDELQSKLAAIGTNLEQLGPEMQELQKKVVEMDPGNAMWVQDSDDTGWLGIEISEISADRAKELKLSADRGVEVVGVEADSPAARAGLQEHDVIATFDGQTVEGRVQFRRLVRETPPGRSVSLGVSRDGNAQTIDVVIGERNEEGDKNVRVFAAPHPLPPSTFEMPDFNFHFVSPEEMDMRTPLLGINAEDLDGQLGAYFGAPEGHGVLVREVRKGTPADKAGLKAGDVIARVDDKPVKSLHELRADLRDKSDQKSVNLGVIRKGSAMTLPIEIEKPRPIDPPQMTHRAQL